jgi:hypothetical protein
MWQSILVSLSFWSCVIFAMDATSNTTTNFCQRELGNLHGKSHRCWWQVGSWARLVGCLGFLFLDCGLEKIAFWRVQSMKQKLVRGIWQGMRPLQLNIHDVIWKLQTRLTLFLQPQQAANHQSLQSSSHAKSQPHCSHPPWLLLD